MTPSWNSIDEVARELGVEHLASDRASLRTYLRKRLAEMHPDTTGGSFGDDEARTQFYRIEAAIRLLENLPDTMLVPVQHLEPIVVRIVESLKGANTDIFSDEDFQHATESAARQFGRRKVLLPRITSALMLTVCSTLLMFPGQFAGNSFARSLFVPSVYELYENRRLYERVNPSDGAVGVSQTHCPVDRFICDIADYFRLPSLPKDHEMLQSALEAQAIHKLERKVVFISLPFLALSLFGLLWTWIREQKLRQAVEYLASEDALHIIFESILQSYAQERGFKFRDLLVKFRNGIANAPPLPQQLSETVARGLINRLLRRKVIVKGSQPGLDEWYRLRNETSKEVESV